MAGTKKYDLLIFDWDGTLADSAAMIVSTMREAIAALNLPPREDHQIAELIGLGFNDGLHRLYPEFEPGQVLQLILKYREGAPTNAYTAPLFEGALDSVKTLHAHGYTLAVATGKSRVGLDRSFIEHPDLPALFTLTKCADETADKPHPLMLQEILAETGVPVHRALMIGDTEYDAAMAKAAGMPMLGVACGVHEPGRILRHGALAVIEDARAIPGWLARSV
jgi:phosphoglycolate phosphatase